MARYLITGGAGFIGSNLSEELLKKGHEVRVLDNFFTGKEENIQHLKKDIELVWGDVRDLETVQRATKDIDYVLHQAALSSVPMSIEKPTITNNININGTVNVLTSARDKGVKRVVIASSASIYGNSKALPKLETMKPEPISPYAVTKHVGELYAQVYYKMYGLETVSLRYFNVFGPRQDPSSQYSGVISIFVSNMLKDKAPTIYGDGNQTRDFIYVDNVCEASILSAVSSEVGHGEILNIASGDKITLNQLVKSINKILNKNIKPKYSEARKGDIKYSYTDISKAKKLLGYQPKINFEQGLKKLVEKYY